MTQKEKILISLCDKKLTKTFLYRYIESDVERVVRWQGADGCMPNGTYIAKAAEAAAGKNPKTAYDMVTMQTKLLPISANTSMVFTRVT